jgi:hypothetical protein
MRDKSLLAINSGPRMTKGLNASSAESEYDLRTINVGWGRKSLTARDQHSNGQDFAKFGAYFECFWNKRHIQFKFIIS